MRKSQGRQGKREEQHPQDLQEKKNKRKKRVVSVILWVIAFALALGVLIYACVQLGQILWGYHVATKTYNEVAEQMDSEKVELPSAAELELTINENSLSDVGALEDETTDEETVDAGTDDTENAESTGDAVVTTITVPDFNYLQSINADVIGWVQIPGTVVNYPILRGSDNSYYLKHTYDGQQSSSGSIFMDAGITDGFADKNAIIYGHNMKNGSMFATLNSYRSAAFWLAHPYVYITTPEDGQMIYQVFAAYQTSADSAVYYYGFGENEEYAAYLEQIMSYSIFDANVSVTIKDSIITLSTCTSGGTYRFIVHAVRIS